MSSATQCAVGCVLVHIAHACGEVHPLVPVGPFPVFFPPITPGRPNDRLSIRTARQLANDLDEGLAIPLELRCPDAGDVPQVIE